jgi:ketosteroid isomerase-like protein
MGSEWDGFACIPETFYDAGNTIVVTAWYSGTYKATGKKMRSRATHIWQLEGGRIIGFEQFADTHALRQAIKD